LTFIESIRKKHEEEIAILKSDSTRLQKLDAELDEFKQLIADFETQKKTEEDIQKFLEGKKWFFGTNVVIAKPKTRAGATAIFDYVLTYTDGSQRVVELKLPTEKIVDAEGKISAAVAKGLDQLIEYLKQTVAVAHSQLPEAEYLKEKKPRGTLLIGRTTDAVVDEKIKSWNYALHLVEKIITCDQVIADAEAAVKQLKGEFSELPNSEKRGDIVSIPLTPEQIENLKLWKNSLQTEEAKNWAVSEDEAEEKIHSILTKVNFEGGGDLTTEDFNELFRLLKKFSANRALSNLLYKSVGLENFNRQLRNLYYGKDPFVKRVDDFFKLKGIGIQTLSQFLVAFDSRKYPLITSQTKETLNLDSTQEEAARKEALERYGIQDPAQYLERTIDFLTDTIVFETIKSITGVEKYTQVNNLLWFGKLASEEGSEEPVVFTSVSLENDLRNYLVSNPGAIEKGLTIVQKEFDTKEIGRIDLLCKDKNGNAVVVELKKGRKSDEVVGQILRYIGWVMNNQKTKVRGIIVVNEPDERLEYAVAPLKNMIDIKYYRVKFEISNTYDAEA